MKYFPAKFCVFLALITLAAPPSLAGDHCKKKAACHKKSRTLPEWLELSGSFEYGFSFFANHKIRWGSNDNFLDYVNNGGQNVLFSNWRVKTSATFARDHELTFTYQPIFVETSVQLKDGFKADNFNASGGEAVNMKYYFPFYRLSYLYHAIHTPNWRWSVGLGLQLRNATIVYTKADGSARFSTGNVGPVPLLHTALKYTFDNGIWLGLDAQGFWAPIKYINGSNTDVEGWIYEATLDAGVMIWRHLGAYGNARLLGGGNRGNSNTARPNGNTYSENFLNNLSFNLGLMLKW